MSKLAYLGAVLPASGMLLSRAAEEACTIRKGAAIIVDGTNPLYNLVPVGYLLVFVGVVVWLAGIARAERPRRAFALSFLLFIASFIVAFLVIDAMY